MIPTPAIPICPERRRKGEQREAEELSPKLAANPMMYSTMGMVHGQKQAQIWPRPASPEPPDCRRDQDECGNQQQGRGYGPLDKDGRDRLRTWRVPCCTVRSSIRPRSMARKAGGPRENLPLNQVPDDPENKHRPYIKYTVLYVISPDRANDRNGYGQVLVRDLEKAHPYANQGEVERESITSPIYTSRSLPRRGSDAPGAEGDPAGCRESCRPRKSWPSWHSPECPR